ncbi:hypothetical protein C8R46DRAFT_937670, partial [Mycena filopes]
MNLHIQCLWGILSATDVPEMPTATQVAAFQRRFTTADEWEAYRDTFTYDGDEAIAKITALRRSALLRKKSPIARNVARMLDTNLHIMFSAVLAAGLQQWRPDVIGGTHDTLYNRAHEIVAIDTFQTVATNHGYTRLSPDLTKVRDRLVVQKLYRNCAWSLMRRRAESELTAPGSVVLRAKLVQDYKRRQMLGDQRSTGIRSNGWPAEVAELVVESFANSDDEYDATDGKYTILPKDARSDGTTAFIRTVDKDREMVGKADGRWQERVRKIVEGAQPSKISRTLP